MDERHAVIDGDRELQFAGVLLGHSTSWAPNKTRWAEITIYRTIAGKYVVSGVGRSTVAGERDKRWAKVCDEPECAIERLHLTDRMGVRYVPHVSRNAIDQARAADKAFRLAYVVQLID